MQALASERPICCTVASRLGVWLRLSFLHVLRPTRLLCGRVVSLHPGSRLRAGYQIELLQLSVPEWRDNVRTGLCDWAARTMAAVGLVGSRSSNRLRLDSLSPDGHLRSRCSGRVLGMAYFGRRFSRRRGCAPAPVARSIVGSVDAGWSHAKPQCDRSLRNDRHRRLCTAHYVKPTMASYCNEWRRLRCGDGGVLLGSRIH